jgi:alpha-L-arabinofuranosidase
LIRGQHLEDRLHHAVGDYDCASRHQASCDAWSPPICYLDHFASIYGCGTAFKLVVNCPSYEADIAENVPDFDTFAVRNEEEGALTFFIVNCHSTVTLDTAISLQGFCMANLMITKF